MLGRMIGAIMVTGIGALVGIRLSLRLKKRLELLKAYQLFLDSLSVKIRYENTTLDRIMQDLSEMDSLNSLSFIGEIPELMKHMSFEASLKVAIDSFRGVPLTDEDFTMIQTLGASLGKSDIEGQISFLEMQKNIAQQKQVQAQEYYDTRGKLYRSLGTLLGAGVGIILL